MKLPTPKPKLMIRYYRERSADEVEPTKLVITRLQFDLTSDLYKGKPGDPNTQVGTKGDGYGTAGIQRVLPQLEEFYALLECHKGALVTYKGREWVNGTPRFVRFEADCKVTNFPVENREQLKLAIDAITARLKTRAAPTAKCHRYSYYR